MYKNAKSKTRVEFQGMRPISIGGGCHMQEEMIEIVDTEGSTIGIRRRSEVHGNPSLLHKVVHVLVFNDAGNLLLQKRSMNKDVAPGKWDTSVGGHVSPSEDLKTAALREMKEELG